MRTLMPTEWCLNVTLLFRGHTKRDGTESSTTQAEPLPLLNPPLVNKGILLHLFIPALFLHKELLLRALNVVHFILFICKESTTFCKPPPGQIRYRKSSFPQYVGMCRSLRLDTVSHPVSYIYFDTR